MPPASLEDTTDTPEGMTVQTSEAAPRPPPSAPRTSADPMISPPTDPMLFDDHSSGTQTIQETLIPSAPNGPISAETHGESTTPPADMPNGSITAPFDQVHRALDDIAEDDDEPTRQPPSTPPPAKRHMAVARMTKGRGTVPGSGNSVLTSDSTIPGSNSTADSSWSRFSHTSSVNDVRPIPLPSPGSPGTS